ncbi:hypothetical protein LCGC14_1637800, partial [marine sediment metagenome]
MTSLQDKEIIIRLLKKSDEDKLFDFFENLSDKSKRWFSPHSFDKETIKSICEKTSEEYQRVVVLYQEKIIGYCVIYFGIREYEKYRYGHVLPEETCTIAPCVVDDFQNMGIGAKLLDHVILVSKQCKMKRIVLWGGVVVSNKPAIRLYKKKGFIINKRWKHPIQRVGCYDMYLDVSENANKIKKTIMIIGAAGSLGQELCKLLLIEDDYNIVAIDIDENNLMYLQKSYNIPIYIENVIDFYKIRRILEYELVDIVVNCAASKHVQWCETNIKNSIDVNILSNLEIMNYLSKRSGKFIFISSDKAIRPSNIYALTKQFTDYIVKFFGFKLVRGVNFLNSKGSVLDIWNKQKENGVPFTVSSQDCRRYFMTLPEMSVLVKEAIEDNSRQVEYIPKIIYDISIKKLFEAYKVLNGIEICEVKEFS